MTDEIVRPWQYSVKLECNAKGYIQPTVHIFSDVLSQKDVKLHEIATDLLDWSVHEVKSRGYKVATDITEKEEPAKNNKEVKK